MTTDSEVLALGFVLPTGPDPIRDGDDAISANARAAVDLYHAIVADPDLGTVLDAAVGRVSRAQHAPALGLYFPEAEGAIGDGVAVDTAAFQAAIDAASAAGGGTVSVAYRASGWLVGALTVKPGVTLAGRGLVSLKKSGAAGNWITLQADTTLTGLTCDTNGTATTNIIYTVSPRVLVERCVLSGSANGVRIADGALDVTVRLTKLSGNVSGVHCGTATLFRIRVERCWFTGWTQRAIYVAGDATHRVTGMWIVGNVIDPTAGVAADPRQPIGIEGDDAFPHFRFTITDNTIEGNDTSHDDPVTPGTADMISLHRVRDFVVANNVLVGSGDVGITVSQQCRGGAVTGNYIARSDSVAICIGSTTSTFTKGITVTGNTCVDNFQNRMVDGPERTQAGILLEKASLCTVSGNDCDDTQGSPTQTYAVSVVDSTSCTIGANGFAGSRAYYASGVNAAIRWAVPPLRAVKTAAETVASSIALQDDDQLTVPLGVGATYQLEGLIGYVSTTTADLLLSLTLPAGATVTWVADGPASTTASPNTVVSRSRLVAGSTATLGGTGGNAMVAIRGIVTTGATAGSLTLRWAQAVAEASNTQVLADSWLTLTRVA